MKKEIRPDFVLQDESNNTVILEHFGMNEEKYVQRMKEKRACFEEFCKKNERFFFVETHEDDIKNLVERLGKKLNATPLKRALWN